MPVGRVDNAATAAARPEKNAQADRAREDERRTREADDRKQQAEQAVQKGNVDMTA